MPVRILTIPFDPEKAIFQDEDLVKFMLNKRIKRLCPEFFQLDSQPYWTVFVEYETILSDLTQDQARNSGDLDDAQSLLFQRLREWRKERAENQKVPVYIIATNSQLIDVVKKAPATLEALRRINGFGKKKIERHGKELISLISGFYEKRPVRNEAHKQKHQPTSADAGPTKEKST